MALIKWIVPAVLALLAAAVPASAGKAIVIDWQAGVIYPLQDGKPAREPIVTNNGRVLKDRHLGTFRVSEKLREKRSNMYNKHGRPLQPGQLGAKMPYWMRLGRSAQGLHQSSLFDADGPRHRSNGCYRLSRKSAAWLFDWAPVGTPVHVVSSLCSSGYAHLGGARCKTAAKASGKRRVGAAPPMPGAPPPAVAAVLPERQRLLAG